MAEGTKIDPKIPDDEEDSLIGPKKFIVKEEDDAVFLFPSIASLRNLSVGVCLYIYIYIFNNHCLRKTLPRKEKWWKKKVFADSQTEPV